MKMIVSQLSKKMWSNRKPVTRSILVVGLVLVLMLVLVVLGLVVLVVLVVLV